MNAEFKTLVICNECGCAFKKEELDKYSYQCECCGEHLDESGGEHINIHIINNNDIDAEEKLLNAGYKGVKYLVDYSYDDAIIGVTDDCRVVYDCDLMVEWLIKKEGISAEDAIDFIEFNTIRALPYFGVGAPIVAYIMSF